MAETFLLHSLAYLRVQTGRFERENHFDCRLGLSSPCVCLLEKGTLRIRSAQGELNACPGETIFFPQGVPYRSDWYGVQGISFIAIHYLIGAYHVRQGDVGQTSPDRLLSIARQPVRAPRCDRFVCLPPDRCPGVDRMIAGIARIHTDDSRSLETVGLFYSLLRLFMPHLPAAQPTPDRLRSEAICQFLQAHCTEKLPMAHVAVHFRLSESRFYHLFKEQTGLTPIEYKNRACVHRAVSMLDTEELTIEEISERLDFSTPAYFRRVFRRVMGMSPSAYRNCGCVRL